MIQHYCGAFRPQLWILDDDLSSEIRTSENFTPSERTYGTEQSTWSVSTRSGASDGTQASPMDSSEAAADDDEDALEFEQQNIEERLEGFEAFADQYWRIVVYILLNLLTCGLVYAALQSFPSTKVRLLYRRATNLAEATMLLVTFRRKSRQNKGHYFVIPSEPRARVPSSVLSAYLGRLSTRTILGQSARGRETLRLLSEPVETVLVIEARQRRYLLIQLSGWRHAGQRGMHQRFICLRIHSAFIPAFEEYYRLPTDESSLITPSMHPIPEHEVALPVAGFHEEDEAAWDRPSDPRGNQESAVADVEDPAAPEAEVQPASLVLHRPLGIDLLEADVIRAIVGDNSIEVEMAPLLRLFLQSVTHPFFLFQFFSIALWILEAYYYYSATIAFASFMSALLEAMEMRSNAERLARIAASEGDVLVIRRSPTNRSCDCCERISSRELVPGDVIIVESGMVMPCDCTLLQGSAVVTEANLTGEAAPLFKSSWHSAYEEPSSRVPPRIPIESYQHSSGLAAVSEVTTQEASAHQGAESSAHFINMEESEGNEEDEQSSGESEGYFMGAYSASNEAEDLLPTPAFHHMSVGGLSAWLQPASAAEASAVGSALDASVEHSYTTAAATTAAATAPAAAGADADVNVRQVSRDGERYRRERGARSVPRMMTAGRQHQAPAAHHLAWDQVNHVLYAGTRVIEARPERSVPSTQQSTAAATDAGFSSAGTWQGTGISGADNGASATPATDDQMQSLDSAVLALVIRTRLDTAKGTLLHQILLADDQTSSYERGNPGPRDTRDTKLSVWAALWRRLRSRSPPGDAHLGDGELDDPESSDKRLSQMYLDAYKAMVVLLFGGVLATVYSFTLLRPLLSFREALLSALDVLTIVVPPALPAAVTFGIVFALERLLAAQIYCIRPPAVLIASGIEALCFDKTGTLTDLGLDIHEILPVASMPLALETLPGIQVSSDPPGGITTAATEGTIALFDTEHVIRRHDLTEEGAAPEHQPAPRGYAARLPAGLALVMSCCHTLTVVHGQVLGDEVDSRLFELTGCELRPTASPADSRRWQGIHPAQTLFYVAERHAESSFGRVVKIFAFSSEHARMGVIVQRLVTPESEQPPQVEWLFLVKGAPEVVVNFCDRRSVPSDFSHQVQLYTSQGLRVLALAGRRLLTTDARARRVRLDAAAQALTKRNRSLGTREGAPTAPAAEPPGRAQTARNATPLTWSRQRLERSLTLYGLAVLENRLKPDTAAALHELRHRADLHCLMVTGDHIRTAVSVARQSGMMDRDARVIIADELNAQLVQRRRQCTRLSSFASANAQSAVPGNAGGGNVVVPVDTTTSQVVFSDSMHVQKRFSRMEVFSLLAASPCSARLNRLLNRSSALGVRIMERAPLVAWEAEQPAGFPGAVPEDAPMTSFQGTTHSTEATTEAGVFRSRTRSLRSEAMLRDTRSAQPGYGRRTAGSTAAAAERSDEGLVGATGVSAGTSGAEVTTLARGRLSEAKTHPALLLREAEAAEAAPLEQHAAVADEAAVPPLPNRRHSLWTGERAGTSALSSVATARVALPQDEPVALAMTGAAFRLLLREFHRLSGSLARSRTPGASSAVGVGGVGGSCGGSRTSSRRYHFLRQVFLRCTVYARMSAADKTALVHLLRSRFGLCVGMCGDGANDAGALREADVGVGLVERRVWSTSESQASGEAPLERIRIEKPDALAREYGDSRAPKATGTKRDLLLLQRLRPKSSSSAVAGDDEDAVASLAAHFTSQVTSIRAVVKVLTEGRGAAAASLACFKYMGIYSLTQSISTLFLYRIGTVYSDGQFLFQDLVLIMPLALTMGRTASQTRLSRHRPPVRLASAPVCWSMVLQSLVQASFQAAAVYALTQADTVPGSVFGMTCRWNAPCPAATVLFHVVNAQYIWSAIAFNMKSPFRQSWEQNPWFRTTLALLSLLCLSVIEPVVPLLQRMLALAPLSTSMRRWLWVLIALNGLATLLVEAVLNWYEHGRVRVSVEEY